LLNSFTVFLSLNSLSIGEKEPVPLDGNSLLWSSNEILYLKILYAL
jgi:hypothetical protein